VREELILKKKKGASGSQASPTNQIANAPRKKKEREKGGEGRKKGRPPAFPPELVVYVRREWEGKRKGRKEKGEDVLDINLIYTPYCLLHEDPSVRGNHVVEE